MKTRTDPRHQLRVKTVKKLFEIGFRPEIKIDKSSLVAKILQKRKEIDSQIKKNAPAWPIEQIAPIDIAILRLAIYELMFKEEPYKVVIDEAVEIAKEYGSDSSHSFVNGVLGSIVKSKSKKN